MSYLHTFNGNSVISNTPAAPIPKRRYPQRLRPLLRFDDSRKHDRSKIRYAGLDQLGRRHRSQIHGGTGMATLSKAMAKKFGFTVSTTSDESVLKNHLKQGGMAIGNCGGSYSGWRGYSLRRGISLPSSVLPTIIISSY